MTLIVKELYDGLVAAGVSEETAKKAAESLSDRDKTVNDIKTDVAIIKWMLGVVLAFVIAISVKLFTL